jgi:acetyl-CoA C-acetyltransferase
MGQTAENVREIEGISRREMDEFALSSQQRAAKATASGFFEEEITPIALPDGTRVADDDCPRPATTLEALAQLRPAFRPDGQVTAGNSCPLNDGAAAVLVMSRSRASDLGITPKARIVASAVSGINPEIMGLGPVEAGTKVLARLGCTSPIWIW